MRKSKRNVNPAPTPAIIEHKVPAPPPMATYLENIRNEVLGRHAQVTAKARDAAHDVDRIIADLEDWRNEIDATIAFLKASRR